MNNDDNLLSLVYRWAYRQNENFSTEVFAHLIRHLLAKETTAGVDLLNYLTGQRFSLNDELANVIEVRTQVSPYDGYNIAIDGPKVWVGLYFDSPNLLTFESQQWLVVPEASDQAGFGTVEQTPFTANRIKWVHRLVLDSEETHFFARSAASQLACIGEFLDRCFEALPKIKAESPSPG